MNNVFVGNEYREGEYCDLPFEVRETTLHKRQENSDSPDSADLMTLTAVLLKSAKTKKRANPVCLTLRKRKLGFSPR